MKKETLVIRMSQLDKERIRTEAKKKQMSMSEYLIYLARRDAFSQEER